MWMYSCTYAVMVMTFAICAIPLFTGEVIGLDMKTGDIQEDRSRSIISFWQDVLQH